MDRLLKILTCLMITVIISIQIALASPYRSKLTNDSINGRVLKLNETLIYRGTVTLDVMGEYTPNTAIIMINGESKRLIDVFPIELTLCDGDLVEIQSKQGNSPFYVYLSSRKGYIKTDLKVSTILINSGINRLFRVLYDKEL